MNTQRVTLPIHGLGYGGDGALTVERALAKVPGVLRSYVNPATEMAYVEYELDRVTPDQLVGAVVKVGFQADRPSPR